MHFFNRKHLIFVLMGLISSLTWAADYPEKPIKFIVPYAAGGGTDAVARLMALKLAPILGQSIVVENRPGASSNIGTEMVARAAADGYTVLVTAPNFSTSEALFSKPGWRTEDFAPLIQLTRHANVLVATPQSQLADFKTFMSRAKGSGPEMSFGTPGVASAAHLVLELLKLKQGLTLNHVGYKGSAPLKTDLLGGHVPLGVDGLSGQMEVIKSGKVIPLAVLGPKRSAFAPDIPSLGDFGITDIDGTGWYGALLPIGTPPGVMTKLHAAFSSVLNDSDVRHRLALIGVEAAGGTPEQFRSYLLTERDKWGAVIRAAKIQAD
jgi:tripartite-type tricarboxylate transporter receptor subunit TctC